MKRVGDWRFCTIPASVQRVWRYEGVLREDKHHGGAAGVPGFCEPAIRGDGLRRLQCHGRQYGHLVDGCVHDARQRGCACVRRRRPDLGGPGQLRQWHADFDHQRQPDDLRRVHQRNDAALAAECHELPGESGRQPRGPVLQQHGRECDARRADDPAGQGRRRWRRHLQRRIGPDRTELHHLQLRHHGGQRLRRRDLFDPADAGPGQHRGQQPRHDQRQRPRRRRHLLQLLRRPAGLQYGFPGKHGE